MKTVLRAIWISLLTAFGPTLFSWKEKSTIKPRAPKLSPLSTTEASISFFFIPLGNC